MLKNEVVQTVSLNIKFSYLAKNSKFSRSNSYFLILTPTFLRDGFLNSYFQNPSENSAIRLLDLDGCYKFIYLMTNSADPDQLASSECRVYPGSARQGLRYIFQPKT